MLVLFSDAIKQTNKFFIFRDLLNFTTKCIGGQIKAFSFLFCTVSGVKTKIYKYVTSISKKCVYR